MHNYGCSFFNLLLLFSVGAFNGEPSVRSCINIKDAAAQLANDEKE